MWGWKMIPNDSVRTIPTHMPGVKNSSGPGRVSMSGRSLVTRCQSSTGPPKSSKESTSAPAQMATYIQAPWKTSVQYTARRPPTIRWTTATVSMMSTPNSNGTRPSVATSMM